MTGVEAEIIAPPRLTGQPDRDVKLLQDWVFRLYEALALTVSLQSFVNTTNERLDAIEEALAEIGALDDASTSHDLPATYSDTSSEGALNALGLRINSIIGAAESFVESS